MEIQRDWSLSDLILASAQLEIQAEEQAAAHEAAREKAERSAGPRGR